MTSPEHYPHALDCVHCGLCLPVCPTYDELGTETDSPRGRIYLMRALIEGRVQQPATVRAALDRCLDCRACETACPSGVRYGALLEATRENYERTAPARTVGGRLRRWLLQHVVSRPARLRGAFYVLRAAHILRLDRAAARLRLLPRGMRAVLPSVPPAKQRRPLHGTYTPKGTPRGRVALFTGCVMEQLFGHVHRATIDVLVANGFVVDVPAQQTCCGALLLHNGQGDAARALLRANVRAFANAEAVVHNSAGCGAALAEAHHHLPGDADAEQFAAKCADICEFLDRHGMVKEPAPFVGRVAYDDPCHLCHAQGVRTAPRQLLARVPGLQLVAHADPERCCGSAGIYNLVHPELAEPIGAAKAAALIAAEPDAVATGNPGCMMQIGAHLAAAGSACPVLHPVELLRPSTATEA